MSDLLLHPAENFPEAEEVMLQEITPVFTAADNLAMSASVTKEEVYKTVCNANLHAAPGSDGINSFVYKECWESLGDPLTDVVSAVFSGQQPTVSQRTSLMVFGSKP